MANRARKGAIRIFWEICCLSKVAKEKLIRPGKLLPRDSREILIADLRIDDYNRFLAPTKKHCLCKVWRMIINMVNENQSHLDRQVIGVAQPFDSHAVAQPSAGDSGEKAPNPVESSHGSQVRFIHW